MTLILYAKCKGGFVLVADKQGSVEGGEKLTVQKVFWPKNKKYVLALAGEGIRIEQIYSILKTQNLDKKEIEEKVKSIIGMTYEKNLGQIEGILLIKNKKDYETFRIATDYQKVIILPYDAPFACFGLSSGKTIASFFMQFIDLEKSNLKNTAEFVISSLDTVSKSYDGIGTLELGFDVMIVSNKGKIIKNSRFTNNRFGKISFVLEKRKINILNSVSIKTKKIPKKKRTKTSKRLKIKIPVSSQQVDLPDFSKIDLPDSSTIDLSKIEMTDIIAPKIDPLLLTNIIAPKIDPLLLTDIIAPKIDPLLLTNIIAPKIDPLLLTNIIAPKIDPLVNTQLTCKKCGKMLKITDISNDGMCDVCELNKKED